MTGIEDGVVGQRVQLPEAVEHVVRVAPGQVGSTAPVEEQGVSRQQTTADVEALASRRVAGGVEQGDVDVADRDDVAGRMSTKVFFGDPGGPGHPWEFVFVHVNGHVGPLEHRGDTLDAVVHHRSTDVIGVVVRGQRADEPHAVGLDDVEEVGHAVRRIHHDTFPAGAVSDEVDEVHHLAGERVGGREIVTGEKLAEVHAIVHGHRVDGAVLAGSSHLDAPSLVSVEQRRGELTALRAGDRIPYAGTRFVEVDADLARAFTPGDRLIVVQEDGSLVHVPREVADDVDAAVARAHAAFIDLAIDDEGRAVGDRVTDFYERFAKILENDETFAPIGSANTDDVARARAAGRAVGRLVLSPRMRSDMIAALRMWRDTPDSTDRVIETVEHDDWSVTAVSAPLGVVGFVFEGRPNVFADATGVLRGGNTTVMRIGSDALATAEAIMTHAVRPSLIGAGLPEGCVQLVGRAERSAGHALFSDRRVALAVARGSGPAVAQLGAVARQSGIAVSLHGTGGAWMMIDAGADLEAVRGCVAASLDRKVCNTLNVVVLIGDDRRIAEALLDGVERAAAHLDTRARLHVVDDAVSGSGRPRVDLVDESDVSVLTTEWEWDDSPELSVVRVDSVAAAIALFDAHSPHFIVSALVGSPETAEVIYRGCDAPFVGDGFTRWVDGQYALRRPELGLSNWQSGRLFARGSILSGDGVHTVRYRAHTPRSDQRR